MKLLLTSDEGTVFWVREDIDKFDLHRVVARAVLVQEISDAIDKSKEEYRQ